MELIITYILLCLTVFAISGGWLYSELLSGTRNKWIKYWSKAKRFSKLQYYGICSLCVSFPIALAIEWAFLPYITIYHYIFFALSVAGVSWLLNSMTQFFLYGKWAFEQYAKYRQMEFKRNKDDLK